MKRITILIAGLLIILAPTVIGQDCTSQENVFSFTFQNKKYEIVKELYSWNIATQCAVDRGGYLVQINSKEEQDTVFRSIINGAKISTTYKRVTTGGGAAYLWIGGTDKVTEGTWLWDGNNDGAGTHFWSGQGLNGASNGVSVGGNYNNWGGASQNPTNPDRRNEPDNFGNAQDGAAMGLTVWPSPNGGLGIAGEWNDIGDTIKLYFVIEYDDMSNTNPEELRTQVTVFPNPATDHLTVTSAGTINPLVAVRIYNILGSVIYEKKGIRIFELPIDLSDYQSGAYFIHAELAKGQSVRQKIMIR